MSTTPNDTVQLLDSATTWFVECENFRHPGMLTIRMVEGSRTGERESVDVAGTSIGPYDIVAVTETSRVVEIDFDEVWTWDCSREGRERPPEGNRIGYSDYLQEIPDDDFDHLIREEMMQFDWKEYRLRRWFVWTEDSVSYVVSRREPVVRLTERAPDLTIERSRTFFA